MEGEPARFAALEPGGMQQLWCRSAVDLETHTETWTLKQSGWAVGALLKGRDGSWIEHAAGRSAIALRTGRAGWWVELLPSEPASSAVTYTPWLVRAGGVFVSGARRFTLRMRVLGDTWRLADESRGTIARIRRFTSGDERIEVELGKGAPDATLLVLLLLASCWLIAREPQRVGGGGPG